MMKRLSFSGKWLKFLSWPGIALITAGLVVSSLAAWQPVAIALMLLGVGLLLLGLSFSGQTAGAFWQQRSTQVGTNAVIATIAIVAILGLLNFLAVEYSARLDLTETKLFTLAPATEQITKALDRPVRVVIFDSVRNPKDVQLLESYARLNSDFSFEYIDPYSNPREAQAFGVTQPGMVFLQVGDDQRFLQTIGAASQGQTMGAPEGLSERQLTNALDQIVNDRTLTVYFVQGHGEYAIDGSEAGFQQAVTALQDKGYTVDPLNLAETQTIPDDANVIVVAGPAQDFFDAEVTSLQTYLDDGGGVLLMLDPRSDGGLNRLLDEWGVLLDDRIVLDTSGAGQFVGLGPAAPIVSDYGDHPITREFGNGRSFFPIARPVELETLPTIDSTAILLTNAQSRAEAIAEDGNLAFDPEAPADGPYVLGVALSRPAAEAAADTDTDAADTDADATEDSTATADDAEPTPPDTPPSEEDETVDEARLVVIGNSTFATDGAFDQQLNGDIFLNSVNWLGQGNDATLSIRPKTVTDRRLAITGQQAVGLGIFSLLVLPVTGLVLAILMAWRRR